MVPYLIGSEKSQRIVLTSQHEVGAFFWEFEEEACFTSFPPMLSKIELFSDV